MLTLLAAAGVEAPRFDDPGSARAAVACPAAGTVPISHARTGTLGQGAWSWFGDPRAVQVNGAYAETVVGWIDWTGKVTVGAYVPKCGVEQVAVVAHLFHDDHSAPSLLVGPDNRITVFWSAHNGASMQYRTTVAPEDISAWTPAAKVTTNVPGELGFTYPNPVELARENHSLYLFWRGADWSADYSVRGAAGTWSQAHRLIVNHGQRPYVKVASNGKDTIAFAFTNGHPRNITSSIYYAAYRAGWLRHAGGRRITPLGRGPIKPSQADLVYSGPGHHAASWVWDVALDARGRPVIVYATFRSLSNHAYWYARWNGREWINHFLTYAGPSISPHTIEFEYSGGIALDHANPSIVYLSRKVHGRFEVERWVTRDAGYRWDHAAVGREPGVGQVRPVVPRGTGGGGISLLWLSGPYNTYSEYRTSIAYLR